MGRDLLSLRPASSASEPLRLETEALLCSFDYGLRRADFGLAQRQPGPHGETALVAMKGDALGDISIGYAVPINTPAGRACLSIEPVSTRRHFLRRSESGLTPLSLNLVASLPVVAIISANQP